MAPIAPTEEVVPVEFIVELWELLTVEYPTAGISLAGLLTLGLLVWGVRASAY